jgi:hypothetical protein
LRKRRKHPAVVPEIKPPVLPPLVQICKGGRDVLSRAPWPQLEGAATGSHCHTDLLRLRRRGEELHGKEMGPQVPVRVNPQKTLANRHEDGRLHDRVGVEVMQLHPVVVQERPHEAARWHSKPPLMERDETDHIPRQGVGSASLEGVIHSGCSPSERGRSRPSATRASRSSTATVEKGHGSRGGMTVTLSAIAERRWWRQKGGDGWFPFLWLLS